MFGDILCWRKVEHLFQTLMPTLEKQMMTPLMKTYKIIAISAPMSLQKIVLEVVQSYRNDNL